MKHLLTFIFSVFLLTSTVPTFAQTPMPVCNEDAGISWALNTEPDMDKYTVYASNNPIDVTVDNTGLILMQIPHNPADAVDDGNGNQVLKNTLATTLAEGPKYFRVSASDQSKNESPLSLEVSCDYNKKPGTPTGVTVILKFK